jgi:hypothetical protein
MLYSIELMSHFLFAVAKILTFFQLQAIFHEKFK